MASGGLPDRRVRPRQQEEVEYESEGSNLENDASEGDADSGVENSSTSSSRIKHDDPSESDDSGTPSEDEGDAPAPTDLKDISFGALAQAQAALGPSSRKRKRTEIEPSATENPKTNPSRKPDHDHRAPKDHSSRTSKHAPAVQSSRRAVSRRLEVFEPNSALKSRDPRFDPLIQSSSSLRDPNASEKANKNYSFLTEYQASEILALKSQIKKSKTAEDAAMLKRQLMSLESKLRRAEALNREREIQRKHKRGEREAIRSGAKERPYYLKRSDAKREVLAQRFEGMSKKERDKAVERKRKRVKGKESRDMPRVRRER